MGVLLRTALAVLVQSTSRGGKVLWANLTSAGRSWASFVGLALTGDADAARTGSSRAVLPLGGQVALSSGALGRLCITCGGMDRMLGERFVSGERCGVICIERVGGGVTCQ